MVFDGNWAVAIFSVFTGGLTLIGASAVTHYRVKRLEESVSRRVSEEVYKEGMRRVDEDVAALKEQYTELYHELHNLSATVNKMDGKIDALLSRPNLNS